MNKIIKLTTLIFTLSLASCGANNNNTGSTSTTEPTTSQTSSSGSSSSSSSSTSTSTGSSSSSTSQSNLDFEGVIFEDQTFDYDGKSHSIYCSNYPSGTSISYSNNGKTAIGTYTVTATLSKWGYNTKKLTAVMTIVGKSFDAVTLSDKTVYYDGVDHKIEVEGTLPTGTAVKYTTKGMSDKTNTHKDIGSYEITATLTCTGYTTKTLTATLNIVEGHVGSTNSNTKFTFDSNVQYDDLIKELRKGNFTVESTFGYKYFYSDGTTKVSISSEYEYACADGMYARVYHDFNPSSGWCEYEYEFAKTSGEYTLHNDLYGGEDKGDYEKAPADTFFNTYIGPLAVIPEVYTQKSSTGGFENKWVNSYKGTNTDIEIGTNEITFTLKERYVHPEWEDDEFTTYKFKNIGNTVVNIPEGFVGNVADVESYGIAKFSKDGVDYNYYDNKITALITLTYVDKALFEPGVHILLPELYGVPVKRVTMSYYNYNTDYSGYTLNAYFDTNGYYKGDYEELGKLESLDSTYIKNKFVGCDGTFNYYDSWH